MHSMGDAGLILFGRPGREILAAGTVVFAIMAAGTESIPTPPHPHLNATDDLFFSAAGSTAAN